MPVGTMLRAIARNPGAAFGKVSARLGRGDRRAAQGWAEQHAQDPAGSLMAIDPVLWEEACSFAEAMRQHAVDRLGHLRETTGLRMGGAADYRILYFLVRLVKPQIVIETGVAMGYSTRTILMALRANGGGRLYSSDLPYFRLDDAEDLVGYLVEDDLRDDAWEVQVDGDRKVLPRLADKLDPGSVGFFHYDSDKRESGHRFAMKVLKDVLASDALLVFDDVNDSLWFSRFAQQTGASPCVFRFIEDWPKYIGVIGLDRYAESVLGSGDDEDR
jgi:predicted O-methyltransferase YrrM